MTAYLDNSATTAPSKSATDAVNRICTSVFGNPSSIHQKGVEASSELEKAREILSSSLGCEKKEFYFTPSGTVANNTAIFGTARAKKRTGNKIVTSAFEHPSVMKCMDFLETEGFEIVRLKPDGNGNIPLSDIEQAIDEKTVLVSLMAVNNEVGSILPTGEVKKIIKRKKSPALFHIDAVQGFLKIPIKASSADMICVSAHKIHGIKGAGGLYISKAVKIRPYILGGGQENGMFSGTEALPAIAAFGAAASEVESIENNFLAVKEKRDYLFNKLALTDGVFINSPENALPYIVNVSVSGIPSQVTVNGLSEKGVYVSAGSACSKGHRSEVLESLNLSPERIDTAVRISLSRFTTTDELDYFCECLCELIKQIRR